MKEISKTGIPDNPQGFTRKGLEGNRFVRWRRINFVWQGSENAVVAELRQVFADTGRRNLDKRDGEVISFQSLGDRETGLG